MQKLLPLYAAAILILCLHTHFLNASTVVYHLCQNGEVIEDVTLEAIETSDEWKANPMYKPGQFYVKMNEKTKKGYWQWIASRQFRNWTRNSEGFSFGQAFPRLQDRPALQHIYLLKMGSDIDDDLFLKKLNASPYVEYAEKVPMHYLFYTPNDPDFSGQWNLEAIQAETAWDLQLGCTDVTVAIVDDAVRGTHEDLAANMVAGFDVSDNDTDANPPASASTASFSHGTHCAGITAAVTDNATGIASIGMHLKIMPVKCKPDASSGGGLPGAIDGLEYAISQGVDVISMSWGGGGASTAVQTMIDVAHADGIIMIAAAGNDNTAIPMFPASYDHIISVGATAIGDQKASFSNFGATIDVMAPGRDIFSTVAGAGGANNAYDTKSGTSMACPLVSGLAGLMKCYNPNITPDELEDCLEMTADNIDAENPSLIGQLGAGRVNARQALLCLQVEPLADFTIDFETACIGQPINLTDMSSGVDISDWQWSFPGGTPSSASVQNPTVSYSANGTYTITLTATNVFGVHSTSKTVTIQTPTAVMNGSTTIIEGGVTSVWVEFVGAPPYTFAYTDGTSNFTETVMSNPYFFSVSPMATATYTLLDYSDGFCNGTYSGEAIVTVVAPSASSSCEFSNLFGDANSNGTLNIYYDEVEDVIFASGGNPDFAKYNGAGDLLWAKEYNTVVPNLALNYIAPAPNGDFLLSSAYNAGATDNDMYVTRVDGNGDEIWTKSYGTSLREQGTRIISSIGDTYIVAAWHAISGISDDVLLLRIDGNGDIIWSKRIAFSQDDQMSDLISNGVGGCIVTGGSILAGNRVDIFLGNIDFDGNEIWMREYSGLGISPHDFPLEILQTADGGFAIAGENWQQGSGAPAGRDGFLLKIDAALEVEWVQKFDLDAGSDNQLRDVAQDASGDLYVTGKAIIGGNERVLVIKYDITGNFLWSKAFYNGSVGRITNTNSVPDDNMLLLARANTPLGLGSNDILLVRTNTDFDSCIAEDVILNLKTETFTGMNWTPSIVDHIVNVTDLSVTTIDLPIAKNALCGECCEAAAAFVASDTTVCVGATIDFINFSALATSYRWLLDGTEISTDANTSYTFNTTGNYLIALLAANGPCEDTIDLVITVLDQTADAGADQTICAGNTAQLQASGGITYIWSPIDWLSDPTIANPIASPPVTTLYTVTVWGADGCSMTDEVLITIGPNTSISAAIGAEDAYCEGDEVQVTNESSAPVGTDYFWDFENGTPANFNGDTPPPVTFPSEGIYIARLIAIDPVCGNDTAYRQINIYPPPIANTKNDTTICFTGGDTPSFEIGWTPIIDYDYNWTPTGGLSDPTIANPVFTGDTSITYYMEVISQVSGCTNLDSIVIEIVPTLETFDTLAICDGQSIMIGSEIVTAPGTFMESFTTATGCDSTHITQVIANSFNVVATATDNSVELGLSTQLMATVTADILGENITYEWLPSATLSCADCPNPIATPIEATTYMVTARDENGCEAMAEVTVLTEVVFRTLLPTAFSPNEDGLNDYFGVVSSDAISIDLMVFNRWGEKVFATTTLGDKWDGTIERKAAEMGVYVYHLAVVYPDGTMESFKGNVTLVR